LTYGVLKELYREPRGKFFFFKKIILSDLNRAFLQNYYLVKSSKSRGTYEKGSKNSSSKNKKNASIGARSQAAKLFAPWIARRSEGVSGTKNFKRLESKGMLSH